MENMILDMDTCVYSSGVYLRPQLITTDVGEQIWVWRVSAFEEPSYVEGGLEIDLREYAPTMEELFNRPSLIELNT